MVVILGGCGRNIWKHAHCEHLSFNQDGDKYKMFRLVQILQKKKLFSSTIQQKQFKYIYFKINKKWLHIPKHIHSLIYEQIVTGLLFHLRKKFEFSIPYVSDVTKKKVLIEKRVKIMWTKSLNIFKCMFFGVGGLVSLSYLLGVVLGQNTISMELLQHIL